MGNSLVDPGAAERGGEALVLLQVGQRVVVELHGLAREPAAEFVDTLLHPVGEASVCKLPQQNPARSADR